VCVLRIVWILSLLLLAVRPADAQSAQARLADWSGPYAGVNAGYGHGNSSQTDPGIRASTATVLNTAAAATGNLQQFFSSGDVVTLVGRSSGALSFATISGTPFTFVIGDGHYGVDGALVGGTLGYNWQRGRWVVGIEGDDDWSNVRGASTVCGPGIITPHPCGTDLNSLGTLRGRVGYTVGPTGSILPYFTGGLAFGDLRGWDSLFPASGSAFRKGWTAGSGIEMVIAPQWTVKLEYLHIDLGDVPLFDIIPGVPESVGLRMDSVRVGLNHRFDVRP
jgi:outer membrane immunogenic protein